MPETTDPAITPPQTPPAAPAAPAAPARTDFPGFVTSDDGTARYFRTAVKHASPVGYRSVFFKLYRGNTTMLDPELSECVIRWQGATPPASEMQPQTRAVWEETLSSPMAGPWKETETWEQYKTVSVAPARRKGIEIGGQLVELPTHPAPPLAPIYLRTAVFDEQNQVRQVYVKINPEHAVLISPDFGVTKEQPYPGRFPDDTGTSFAAITEAEYEAAKKQKPK